jgi:hypothetical protein
METQSALERNAAAFIDMREQLIRQLGIHSVDLIIERSAAEISATYPAMGLISMGDSGVDFEDGEGDAEVDAAFSALNGVILLILARLLGKASALRMTGAELTRNLLKTARRGH